MCICIDYVVALDEFQDKESESEQPHEVDSRVSVSDSLSSGMPTRQERQKLMQIDTLPMETQHKPMQTDSFPIILQEQKKDSFFPQDIDLDAEFEMALSELNFRLMSFIVCLQRDPSKKFFCCCCSAFIILILLSFVPSIMF